MPTGSKTIHQLELLDSKQKPHVEDVSIMAIRKRPTFLRAWQLAYEVSGLEHKQVYGALQIDPSHWTKIMNGSASPPADERFTQFMDVVHNEVPLIWLAEARGYDWSTIRKHRTDTERRLAAVEQENADLKRAIRLMVDAGK